jgi:hypothetical protein
LTDPFASSMPPNLPASPAAAGALNCPVEDTVTSTKQTARTPASDRQLVTAALAAATAQDARAVQKLIESSFGAYHPRPVGDRPNNHGLMGASGSYDLKLIELVTNMQDGVLERYALRKWGDPNKVPYTNPHQAASALLGDPGVVGQHPVTVQFRESDAPTSRTKRLTAVFRDAGCGLRPEQLPSTVFQLGGSYKEDRLYLQGAFGLGGAMTYRNAQAIVVVSRRDPALLAAQEPDLITVAVVEWRQLTKGSSAQYLVDRAWNQPGDKALPWSCPASHVPTFEPGTHLALVSYGVDGLHRGREGDAKSFDTVVNTRLFDPVTPVRFTNEITGRGRSSNLRGLSRRLQDNPNPNRGEGSETLPFNVGGSTYHLPVSYWVFSAPDEPGARKTFAADNHVVLFLSNGQVHHHWTQADFKAKTNLHKIADRVLVTVDTDQLPIQLRTSLFTADRNDLVRNDPALRLEEAVRAFLNDWDPLREENSRLIREALQNSNSKSTLDLARRIGRALTVRGFGPAGGGGTGGTGPGPAGAGGGTPGSRRPVDLHVDPTRITGPSTVHAEIGKTRSIPFIIDVVDSFFTEGRGRLTVTCGHPGIGADEIAVGQVRNGRFRVTVAVPEGLAPAIEELRIELVDWFKASGGLGQPLFVATKLELVDLVQARGSGAGKPAGGGSGSASTGEGGNVAVVWSDPSQQEGWEKTTVGEVVATEASVLASGRPEYAELAPLGAQEIPVVFINEEYPPFKSYLAGRSKQLVDLTRPREEYALGVAVDLLLLHLEQSRREQDVSLARLDEDFLHTAHDSAARAVLSVMPAFDELAKQAGLSGNDS